MRSSLAQPVPVPHRPPRGQGRVRNLKPGDALGLGELMFVAYRGTVEDEGQTLAAHEEDARLTLGGEYGSVVWAASFILLAAEGMVAATVVTDWTERAETLLAFALVRPHAQGHGIGGALIAQSAAVLRDMGRPDWVLAVAPGNPAQRLYERLGFTTFQPDRSAPD